MKKAVKPVLAILLIAAVVGGGYLVYSQSGAPTTTTAATKGFTQTVSVRQSSIASTVSVVGQLEAVQSASLTFERMSGSAKLQKLEVKAGSVVTAGQVLARIDPATYQQAVDQAKSDYQAALEKLEDLKSPATSLELAKADLSVAQAEYNLIKAQEDLDDLAGANLADLEKAVADAQRSLASAQAQAAASQYDTSTEANIDRLKTAEQKAAADHNRMAAESSDSNDYNDKKRLFWNKAMDAQDSLATAQINQQVSILNAQVSALKAKQTLADAQQNLAIAQSGSDTVELAKARLAVESAKVALTTAKNNKADLVAGADELTLSAAQADVDKKKLSLDNAQLALDGTNLKAPFAGTILKTNVAAGNQVSSNTVIVTLADMASLRVVASIDETTIKKIEQGKEATVTFDALPGQTIKGTVGEIPLQGTLQSSVMVYSVPIVLAGAEKLPLLVGMTGSVKVSATSAQNALLVPTMALQKVGAGYQVLVVTDANPQGTPVSVEIGVTDGTYTQITKGLSAGDKVLITSTVAPTATPSTQQMGPGQGGFPPDGGGMPPGGGFQPGGGGQQGGGFRPGN